MAQKKPNKTTDKADEKPNEKPNKFHVRVKPGTADWLRKQVSRDARSVPAVIREIVEEKRRASGA